MDLQTRKLNLISYLAQLQDEMFFDKLETYILKNRKEMHTELQPFTIEELFSRIKMSETDLKEGKFKSQEELENLVLNWQ